jgi:hypothetical protein
VAKSGYRRVITKILVSAAIAVGSYVGGIAAASADDDARFGADPRPFSGLSCSCQETVPPGGPTVRDEELNRGIRAGFSA